MKTYTVEVRDDGKTNWFNSNGKLHREDGPAVEWTNGYRAWYLNDKRHRTDGPAIEYADGSRSWYLNDERHRTDGPAIEHTNGDLAWYLSGKRLSEQEFNDRHNVNEMKLSEVEALLGKKIKIVSE